MVAYPVALRFDRAAMDAGSEHPTRVTHAREGPFIVTNQGKQGPVAEGGQRIA